jgi:hypothetical protein
MMARIKLGIFSAIFSFMLLTATAIQAQNVQDAQDIQDVLDALDTQDVDALDTQDVDAQDTQDVDALDTQDVDAQDTQDADAQDAEDELWIKGHTVSLQALDKITARISTIEVPVGAPHRFGTLEIIIHACTTRPPTMAPENAALLEVRIVDHNDIVGEESIFLGWMFSSSPGLNALEHPVYDVIVLSCIKE